MRPKELTGQRFGRLIAVNRITGGSSKWLCLCDCGKERIVYGTNLVNGKTTSCGCSRIKHGESHSKLYNIHAQMLRKGVCEEWKDYTTFRTWAMENGYDEGMSIKRIDISKPYEPDNCVIKN